MQAGNRTPWGPATGKTRYVFAGTSPQGGEAGTKVCPRCGQLVFEDMDVCYGCLYDFSQDERYQHGGQAGWRDAGQGVQPYRLSSNPFATLHFDDLDEPDELDEGEAPPASSAGSPRHRKQPGASPDDTLDLSAVLSPDVTRVMDPARAPIGVTVVAPSLSTWIAVPQEGLSVGRADTNDLVLRERTVSRNHLRLTPKGTGVIAQDLGATNPALVRGHPLRDEVELAEGDEVEVCGVTLRVKTRASA